MADNNIVKIDNSAEKTFQVTWDVGRRCNYDCSYCHPIRHDNFSSHASLETLTSTFDFVLEYFNVIKKYTKIDQKLSISFTGGEPTNNPNFLKMIRHVKEHESYKDSSFSLNLTTNGTFSEQYANQLIDLGVGGTTISYHCESDIKLKKKVVDRIYQYHNANIEGRTSRPRVNIMFHSNPEYFNECVDLANQLRESKIEFTPRIIGDGKSQYPYTHTYTDQQMEVFRSFWEKKEKNIGKNTQHEDKIEKIDDTSQQQKKEENKVNSLGRMCCGGRKFCKTNTQRQDTQSTFIENTNFQGWRCMVNWHWLHIEQQTDQIFHHQTCQATFNTSTGSIGKISESGVLLEKLKKQLETGTMPVIVCSRKFCGCGLCLSKAKSDEDIKELFHDTVKGLEPLIGEKLY